MLDGLLSRFSQFRDFYHFLKKMKLFKNRYFYKGVLLGFIGILFSVLWPALLAKFLSDIEVKGIDKLMLVLIITCFFAAQYFMYLQVKINIKCVNEFTLNSISVFRKTITRMDWHDYKSASRGQLSEVLMTHVWRIRQGVWVVISLLIPNIFLSFCLSAVLIVMFPRLFYVFFLCFLFMLIIQIIGSVLSSESVDDFHVAWKNQIDNVNRFLDQIILIRLNRNSEKFIEKFDQNTSDFISSNTRKLKDQTRLKILDQTINVLMKIVLILYGVFLIEKDDLNWSQLLFAFFILNVIQSKLAAVPGAFLAFLDSYFSYSKVLETTNLLTDESDSKEQVKRCHTIDSLVWKNLRIKVNDEVLISDLNLNLTKGKVYILKGMNGSGKTTLIETLLGLVAPSQGEIMLNAESLSFERYKELSYLFGYVPQEVNLFQSTVAENVLIGKPFGQELLTLSLWPKQLRDVNRLIGDGGKGLSGGEKKRLTILRESLYGAPLIIFDEPENDLDVDSMKNFLELLNELKKNSIIIISTHTLGVFENYDAELIML